MLLIMIVLLAGKKDVTTACDWWSSRPREYPLRAGDLLCKMSAGGASKRRRSASNGLKNPQENKVFRAFLA
ncbi:hypothetical protein [Candidatus Dactylopiibacterium carminicum]|uniref:hypothetical protein n=1 Tax=Candidatus Dactylopiibacterium carminicum TaxID=857335 RepID=UPI001140D54F|nr:hypothetical protein [Candidatus Dactylopiibacterium carminicum]